MKTLAVFISIVLLCVFLACDSNKGTEQSGKKGVTELKGIIKISGADALYPLMKIWAEEFSKDKPGLTIEVIKGGTGKGLDELFEGKCDLAMISRELEPSEESKGLLCFKVTKEGITPIVNKNNPFLVHIMKTGMSRNMLAEVFTGDKYQSWGSLLNLENKDPLKLYTRSDASGVASIWAKYLGKKQENLKGTALEGDENIINAILGDPLGISYCNAHYAFNIQENKTIDGLVIVPIDHNENGKAEEKEIFNNDICRMQRAVYLGLYPHCLCRYLYLVTKDKPENPVIIEFLKWIYTDGQKIAGQSGYAMLRECESEEYVKFITEI